MPSRSALTGGGRMSDARRRRLPRQEADWPGTYVIEGDLHSAWGACVIVDISILGAGLELFGDVLTDQIGRQIVVDVQTPAGAAITFQMVGEIRYSAAGSRGGTRVGIEFGHMSDTERVIRNVLEHMRIVW
jgi:hypothetical protein